MAFKETPRFPDDISYGSRGGPGFKTTVTTTASGYETRIVSWSEARHRYNARFGILNSRSPESALETLLAFFHDRRGMAEGFRYKDWSDYKSCNLADSVSDTDQTIGTGDGVETEFQLIKNYNSVSRTIKKPVSGSVVVSLDDVSQSSGWTVDTTTGVITFSSPPGGSVIVKAGFEFDVPVRFDTDELDISIDSYLIGSADVPLIEIRI